MSGIADLFGAIRRGDGTAVRDLIAADSSLANALDANGNSPILIATYVGQPAIARLLLEHGAHASFFEACALGLDAEVRQRLAGNPAIARQWAHDGWTALHLAAFFGHRETAEALLDVGADLLAVSRNGEGNLAINAAAAGPRAERRPALVRLFIERGCPVDGRGSPAGHTPLHEAAFNGDVELARLLLECGADRTLRTGDGQTPLDVAVANGRDEIARLLRD